MKKAKGPFRTGAVVPFIIIVAVIWAYFFFFFDMHLQHLMEHFATEANGAEVDIARVRTSFWQASLSIEKIQVTSAAVPTKNKVEIEEIHWQILWDALLRGKIVIDDASITGVALGVPRARPGRVLPPPPPPKEGPSAVKKAEDEAMARADAEFHDNVLGDALALLKGGDPTTQLKSVEGGLKSSARIAELQKDLAGKQKEWNDRLAKLPTDKDLAALQDRVKKVKLDHFSGPADIQNSLNQLNAIFADANAKVADVQATQTALTTDLATYQNSVAGLQGLVGEDLKSLEGRLKLPRLDVATLSRVLFGPLVLQKVQQARFYITKARQYMPAKKPAGAKPTELTPHEREKGRNFEFGKPHSYPLFWLKKAALNSKAREGADWSGNLVGEITNVTTDQPLIGEPTEASFKGDFPKADVSGVEGRLTFDHRTEAPIEKLSLHVAHLPVPDRVLIDSPDVRIGLTNAIAVVAVDGAFSGENLKVTSESVFSGPGSIVSATAHDPMLEGILKGAVASVPRVSLNVGVQGAWTDPQFAIESSLGHDLAAAFSKQLEAKIAEARAKLTSFVNDQVGKQRAALESQFAAAKGQVDGVLKQKMDEVNKTKGGIDQAKNDAVKGQSKQLQDQGKKAVDDLKKKFGF